jgi:2-dehydropantoate 2-reductase
MRIAVMGTGAVGGYFGAKLAAAGHELAFIARGEHLVALEQGGLIVQSTSGDLHIRNALFTGDPAAAGIVDLVLFCVKSHATEAAAAACAPMVGPQTMILSLQNGVDNPEKIARIYGRQRTLAGVVYIGAQVTQPGIISHSSGGRVLFGVLDGPAGQGAAVVERAFSTAAIPCEITPAIGKAQWKKLLWNAPFCAISCLTRANVKEIVESESLRKLALDCMAEVMAAAQTCGVELERELLQETIQFSTTLADFKPSMLQDLEAGKRLEFEAFNGVVVKRLREAGKEAPINEVFYGALKYLDQKIREKRAPESLNRTAHA